MSERFEIRPLSSSASSSILLGDNDRDGERVIITSLPTPEIILDPWTPFEANYGRVFARGGALQTIQWTVLRVHTSIMESIQFERDHVKEVLAACSFGEFVLTRTSFGVQMLSTGALKTPRVGKRRGVATWWEYSWQGSPFE